MRIKVGDIDYNPVELRILAKELSVIRNAALETGSMYYAVTLSHAVGVLNAVADELESVNAE